MKKLTSYSFYHHRSLQPPTGAHILEYAETLMKGDTVVGDIHPEPEGKNMHLAHFERAHTHIYITFLFSKITCVLHDVNTLSVFVIFQRFVSSREYCGSYEEVFGELHQRG
jgi:hypothetical protein